MAVLRLTWSFVSGKLRRDVARAEASAYQWVRGLILHLLHGSLKRRWLLFQAVQRYRLNIESQHTHLPVPGSNQTLPIDKCFVPLELRAGRVSASAQLLKQVGLVVLTGDAGSGKSALLSYLVQRDCDAIRLSSSTARLPIYISLEDISGEVLRSSPSTDLAAYNVLSAWFQQTQIEPLRLYRATAVLEEYVHNSRNGIALFCDGFDELGSAALAAVEEWLIRLKNYLIAAPAPNLLVVATRTQALEFAPKLQHLLDIGAPLLELEPFSLAAVYSFLLRWPYSSTENPSDEASRIFTQLQTNPTLLETCTNPLALSLYVDRDLRARRESSATFSYQAVTRAAFYDNIVDHLLVRRRTERLQTRGYNLTYKQARMSFFVDVATDHASSQDAFNDIDESTLTRYIPGLIRQSQSAGDALAEIASDTGLIQRSNTGRWHFIHRSFLDYFIANSVTANVNTNRQIVHLITRLRSEPLRYQEAFYLACGLMAARSSPRTAEVLNTVARNATVGYMFPRAALEAQSYLMPEFVQHVRVYCDKAQDELPNSVLLRDLVTLLLDYEASCSDLGRIPEISLRGEFPNLFSLAGGDILTLSQLNIALAMSLSPDATVAEVLLGATNDQAILALFDPKIIDRLDVQELITYPRLAALLCESALRSTLVARHISSPFGRRSRRESSWSNVWKVSGSRYGDALRIGLPFIGSYPTAGTDFPHLALLAHVRPIQRLRWELLFGEWRPPTFALVSGILGGYVGDLLGFSLWPSIAMVLGGCALSLVVTSIAVFQEILTLPSRVLLGFRPTARDYQPALARGMRFVECAAEDMKRLKVRPPQTDHGGGAICVYYRVAFVVWRRFCPALGDEYIARSRGAVLQQWWTDDLAQIMEER